MEYRVYTQHPVAIDSRDHTTPHGTANDSSRWHKFNEKLYKLFQEPISLLDLGCAGGGFVSDCLNDGHEACGIEGSDYSLLRKRAEWANIPNNLHTADITKPFTVVGGHMEYDAYGNPNFEVYLEKFDVITLWEVAEHISAADWPQLITNIKNHLAPGGLVIMSVSTQHGYHHVCVRNRDVWMEMFESNGFQHHPDLVKYFGDDWIRGPHQNAPESFHLVLSLPFPN